MDTPPDTLQQSPPAFAPRAPAGEPDPPALPALVVTRGLPRRGAESDLGAKAGELVRVRGEGWRVESGRSFADCQLVRLAGVGRSNRGRQLALLHPFDRFQRFEPSDRLRVARWPRWLHALRALLAGTTPFGRLRTAWSAHIDLHAYQLEPALAVAAGLATRLLVADEVGLGKTIQAGLIISELLAREQAARSLILTPAGLRDQWASELRERFAIDAAVVDSTLIRRTMAQLPAGTNPWSAWPVIISSLDFVKRPEVLRALDPFTWDALVVDEAHQSVVAPERSAAVRTLAARARRVVLLTATPHAGDDAAFASLCRIGELRNPAACPEPLDECSGLPERSRRERAHASRREAGSHITMFRRSRADAGFASNRRVHLFRVACTPDERRVHRLLERYTRAVWTRAGATSDARLAMIVLRKRALSSASSLARSVARRLDALFDVPAPATQLPLPFAGDADPEDQTPEDDEPIGSLAAPGLDGRLEREWLTRLGEAAGRAMNAESKIAWLSRLLACARQPAIVFTEYRDTARWLAAALEAVGRVVLLHGGLSRSERLDTERAFRTGAADILVATDAAGEGLNLQHRCRLVVNLELPWNPMRLEQRIGRVDRLGQRRRPHAIHLVAAGTAEERIVRRLVLRQERARRSVGSVADAVGAAREEDVAQAVMSGSTSRLQASGFGLQDDSQPVFSTLDLRETALDEVRRLAIVRAVARGPAGRAATADDAAAAWLSTLPPGRARRGSLARGLVCVFEVGLICGDEESAHQSLVALHVSLTRPLASFDRAALLGLVRSDALRDRALAVASEQLEAARTLHERAVQVARQREQALAAADRRPDAAVQPGMFDRRALRDAEILCASRAARESEELEELARLDGLASAPPVAQARLALVLLVDR